MIKNKASIAVLTTLFQHTAESASQCNKARKGSERHTDKKGRNKAGPVQK